MILLVYQQTINILVQSF